MELVYTQQITVDPAAVDRFGRLRPSSILRYAQEIAGEHCNHLSLSYEQLATKGLFWAVVRNQVQVTRLPHVGEKIKLETWPMPTTRTAYPRSTVAYDSQGKELFRSVTLWVLMDIRSRTMVLPGKSGIDVEGTLRGNELASPRSLAPGLLENRLSRSVCYTDLDRNGHMNNARYLDWIADLLPSDFHGTHPVAELTLCYLNEAREGQSLELTYQPDSSGTLLVDIHRPKEDGSFDRLFSAKIRFEENVL